MDFKVPNDVLGVEDYIRKLAKPRNLNQLSKKQIEYHQKVTALRDGNEEWRVIRGKIIRFNIFCRQQLILARR